MPQARAAGPASKLLRPGADTALGHSGHLHYFHAEHATRVRQICLDHSALSANLLDQRTERSTAQLSR